MSAVIASKDEKPEKPVVVKEEVKPEVKSEEVVEKPEEVAVKEEEKPEEVVVKPEVENTEVVEKPEEATEKPEEVMENTEVTEKPEEQIKEEPLEPLEPLAVAPELLVALTVGPHAPLNPRSMRWCWSPPRSPDPRANSPPSLLAPPTPMKRPSI